MDERIHVAALSLLEHEGFAAFTMDRVAALAGVGKAAIYRRYRSKDDLIAGAVAAELPLSEPPAELTGAAALATIVEDLRIALFESGGLRLLAALLAEEPRRGDLLDLWRERIAAPRVEIVRRALGRSGSAASADPKVVGELALGGLIARYIARGEVPPAAARALAAQLWRLAVGQDRTRRMEDDE